jgi:hypothetical protein
MLIQQMPATEIKSYLALTTHDIVYNIGQVLGMSYLVPDDCLTYTGNVREWIKGKVGINLDQG